MSSSTPQPPKRASIRDVAREAGVSHTMVSLILNGKTSGSERTRALVMDAVKRLDYRPDALYRKAVTARSRNERGETGKPATGILACLLPQWMSHQAYGNEGFYGMLLGGINSTAAEHDYHVLLCPISESTIGIPSVILDGKVDGVLVNIAVPHDWFQVLGNNIPCVCMNRYYPNFSLTYVTPNWMDAARRQVDYAWELGHRNIAFCEQHDGVDHLANPYNFLHSALRQVGGKLVHPELSRYRSKQQGFDELVQTFVEEWITLRPRPTVIITVDGLAVRLIEQFQSRGIRVPEDVSIISRYGHEMASRTEPGLTTYNYPNWEIARTATRKLIEGIRTDNLHPSHIMLEGEMVIRGSARSLTSEEAEASLKT